MTKEHIAAMQALIEPLDTEETRQNYRDGLFPRSELTQDLNRRYRWDLMWAANAYDVVKDADYNDSHINTALKSIVPAL